MLKVKKQELIEQLIEGLGQLESEGEYLVFRDPHQAPSKLCHVMDVALLECGWIVDDAKDKE